MTKTIRKQRKGIPKKTFDRKQSSKEQRLIRQCHQLENIQAVIGIFNTVATVKNSDGIHTEENCTEKNIVKLQRLNLKKQKANATWQVHFTGLPFSCQMYLQKEYRGNFSEAHSSLK